jgi:hypothetical protein
MSYHPRRRRYQMLISPKVHAIGADRDQSATAPRGLFHLSTVGGQSHPGLRAIAPEDKDGSFVNCFDALHLAVALGELCPRPPGYGRESRTN